MAMPPPPIFASGIAQVTVVGGSNAARVDLVLRQSSLLTSTNIFVGCIKKRKKVHPQPLVFTHRLGYPAGYCKMVKQ